jgi:hypothetical protein
VTDGAGTQGNCSEMAPVAIRRFSSFLAHPPVLKCQIVLYSPSRRAMSIPLRPSSRHMTDRSLKDCTIWQVARATSAAATFFESIKCGRDEVEFIDTGFGYNNPCDVLLQDSRRSILKALKEMASSSKKVADYLDSLLDSSPIYHQFNVQRGHITLSDWKQRSPIAAHTSNYLQEEHGRIDHCARTLHAVIRNNSMPSTRDRPTEEASLSSNGDPITETWSIDGLLDRLITGDGE